MRKGDHMIQLITMDRYGEFFEGLAQMHRLRYRVFKERLDWDVETSGDMEVDSFDALQPAYLLQSNVRGEIGGCVRLLPTTGPNMLRDVFPALLDGQTAPASETIWESSRFALDVRIVSPKAPCGISQATCELFAAMIEFGLARNLSDIVTVTDVCMERILRRALWPLRRLGEARRIGKSCAVAGYLEISTEALRKVRQAGGLSGPVLWAPVLKAAA
jgi:acyl homoserine lactone synthase